MLWVDTFFEWWCMTKDGQLWPGPFRNTIPPIEAIRNNLVDLRVTATQVPQETIMNKRAISITQPSPTACVATRVLKGCGGT